MSSSAVSIEGTLKPDGTLELDQSPPLAPGRVRITLQAVESAPVSSNEPLGAFLQRTRRELESADSHFMSEEEVRAHLDWLRAQDQLDEMVSSTGDQRHAREDAGC